MYSLFSMQTFIFSSVTSVTSDLLDQKHDSYMVLVEDNLLLKQMMEGGREEMDGLRRELEEYKVCSWGCDSEIREKHESQRLKLNSTVYEDGLSQSFQKAPMSKLNRLSSRSSLFALSRGSSEGMGEPMLCKKYSQNSSCNDQERNIPDVDQSVVSQNDCSDDDCFSHGSENSVLMRLSDESECDTVLFSSTLSLSHVGKMRSREIIQLKQLKTMKKRWMDTMNKF